MVSIRSTVCVFLNFMQSDVKLNKANTVFCAEKGCILLNSGTVVDVQSLSCVKGRPRVFIFEQEEGRGFTTRRLRVETEDNVFNADNDAGIDLEKMAEKYDTYRFIIRKECG